jgi:hypothetical protein
MSFVIEVNNKYRTVRPRGKYWSLEELQDLVGGYLERIPKKTKVHMRMEVYVNEEGLLHRLPKNVAGTRVAQECGHRWIFDRQTSTRPHPEPSVLVGPVAFIDLSEMEDGQDV